MSDTPETDRNTSPIIGFWSCATVPADFARQLERARDEARDAWEKAKELADTRWMLLLDIREAANRIASQRDDIASERDALRNLLTIALQHGLTDQVRAEAREMLKEKP